MWIIIFIILTLVIGLIFYFRIRINLDNRVYNEKYKEIFEAHKKIGYPTLTNEQQYKILDKENLKDIESLTQYNFVPTGLLNHYINIDPDNYFLHLKSLDLQERMRFDPDKLTDGFYIRHYNENYEYIFVDKQQIEFKKSFNSYDQLLKYIVYDKLKIYAPNKYKYLNKKYYS